MSRRQSPCFVLTLPRSGSTLLRYILDAHPEITCPPETQLASAASVTMSNWMSLEYPESADERRRLAIREIRHSTGTFIRWALRDTGKTLYCDKSLPNLEHARIMLEAFPSARFICLYRHPMDMIASATEACRWGYSGFGLTPYAAASVENLVYGLARAWCERTSHISTIERHLKTRCARVHYESLVTNPTETIGALCDFLGVQLVEGLDGDGLERLHLRGFGDGKVAATWSITLGSLGRGSAVPVSMLPDASLEHMNDLMTDLGYASIDRDWNRRPSPLRAGLATQSDLAVLQAVFEHHVARQLRALPLSVSQNGFRVRIVVEECRGPNGWVLDAGKRSVYPDDGSGRVESSLIVRAAAILAIAAGYRDVADAQTAGDIRFGPAPDWANEQGVRLLALALCGYDRQRLRSMGAFTRDLLKTSGPLTRGIATGVFDAAVEESLGAGSDPQAVVEL